MLTATQRRGAATIELVMAFPFLVALLVCLLGVGQAAILKTNTTVKARHSAWSELTANQAGTALSSRESKSAVRLVSHKGKPSLTLVQNSGGSRPLDLGNAEEQALQGLKNGLASKSGNFVPGLGWGQMTANSATKVVGGTWDHHQAPDSLFQFSGLGESGQFDALVNLLSANGNGPDLDLNQFALKNVLNDLADQMLAQTGGGTGGQNVSFADVERAKQLIRELDQMLAEWVRGFGEKFTLILERAKDVANPAGNPLEKPAQLLRLVGSIKDFGEHLTKVTNQSQLNQSQGLAQKYGGQMPNFNGGSPLSIDRVIPTSVADVGRLITGGGPFTSSGSFFRVFGAPDEIPKLLESLGKLDEALEDLSLEPAP